MGFLSKLLSSITGLTVLNSTNSTLPQNSTNGNSTLGTLNATRLPNFLTNNPLPDGYPWGQDTSTNTNPYSSSPNTGVVRKYNFTVSRGILAPDGYQRSLLLINGAFPGPTIEVNWGDTIQVTVTNNITNPTLGTSMHWHGFLQHNSQWMDGVPGISQCPIAPGKTFTYSFKAELYGTTWYHAHFDAQYSDGIFGPLVVHGPNTVAYDIDVGPITLSDYYHVTYETTVKNITAPQQSAPNPTSDNNLINGKGDFDCTTVTNGNKCTSNAGMAKFTFISGKKHRLRLINTGADASQQFSIDNHTMTIIANDFVPIQPYNTTIVTLGIGQRTDVIVTATGPPNSSYWIRSNITCSSSNQPYALAALYYDKANTSVVPSSTPQPNLNPGCANDPLSKSVPVYPMSPGNPGTTIPISITAGPNATMNWLWYMNASSFRTDYNDPVLLLAKQGNVSYPYSPQWNVINTGTNSSYRFIIENNVPIAHPMHFHGHNFFVLATGTGTWNGSITNPTNPQRRDVQMLAAAIPQASGPPVPSYIVLQVTADNPGTWPLHCHIAWHSSTGLFVDVVENPAAIRGFAIPLANQQLCADWGAYTKGTVVDQIDSGE